MLRLVLILVIVCAVWSTVARGDVTTTSTSVAQQQQIQTQATSSGVYGSGNSGITFKDSFNGAPPIRHLPNASGITYTGMAPQMFSRPSQDKGSKFISSNNMIGIMGAWSVNDLADEDFDVKDVEIDVTTVGISKLSTQEQEAIEVIDFAVQGSETQIVWKKNNANVVAIGTIQAEDVEINSAELFMALAVKAKLRGATRVVLMGEGVKIDLTSFGWGLGFSYNMASVDSDANGKGSVGAGGTGISGGKAGYTKMPYLTFAMLQ